MYLMVLIEELEKGLFGKGVHIANNYLYNTIIVVIAQVFWS